MAGKVKENNKNEVFLQRFKALAYKDTKSQDELAKVFGASRQTISKWMLGQSIPDIDALKKMAEYYGVSADYLLGLSDAVSVDVNMKAAMEYTGLTERAIEHLHAGFDYPTYDDEIDSDDSEKEQYLRVASALIESDEFKDIISRLGEAAKWAYLERALNKLQTEYDEADILAGKTKSEPISKDEQDRITAELLSVLTDEGFYVSEYNLTRLEVRIADCFGSHRLLGLLDIRESLDRQQFLASKSLNSYIDKLVKASYKRARERFEK